MNSSVTESPKTPDTAGAPGDWESARRDKLQKITQLGRDPWGTRFDDHSPIAEIRARANEIKFTLADGRDVPLPNLEARRSR